MIRIILNDLWLDVKRNFLTFILYFIVYAVIVILGVQIALVQFLRDLQISGKDYSAEILAAMESSPTLQAAAVSITAVATILFLWLVLRKMPIRLAMPLYVCAVGEKEKMHYLRFHLVVSHLKPAAHHPGTAVYVRTFLPLGRLDGDGCPAWIMVFPDSGAEPAHRPGKPERGAGGSA